MFKSDKASTSAPVLYFASATFKSTSAVLKYLTSTADSFKEALKNAQTLIEKEDATKEQLDEALKQGKGIVLATAHSSNWELLGGGLALNGYQIVGVAQKQTNGSMDKFINEYRRVIGMDIAYKNSVRDMVRFLSEKKIVGLLMDQDADKNGVIVNFFGRKASTPQGPAVLARMSGSPIVPMFITKRSDGLYKIIIHKHIDAQNTADKKNDILNDITNLTKIIEDHIRIYPKEWFWLHNRWQVKD